MNGFTVIALSGARITAAVVGSGGLNAGAGETGRLAEEMLDDGSR